MTRPNLFPRFALALPALALFTGLMVAPASADVSVRQVLEHYVTIGHARYEDAALAAKRLQDAVDAFLAQPDDASLSAARTAWKAARIPYMQSESHRFGNPVVDEWEGRVNAWPLDEGMIDYVGEAYGTESDENDFYVANVIANPRLEIAGQTIDASVIDQALLRDKLQEAGDNEANVATGYHAVEFMLWGQDLNGTGPGAGNRPASDFSLEACTNGHCDRRRAYLKAVTDLLVADLEEMEVAWRTGGQAAQVILADDKTGLAAILKGLGSLSYGELAGERINLGLLLHDPEEEHDCFSDNTAHSHYHDIVGIIGSYRGHYVRIDGTELKGPSVADLVAAKDAGLATEMDNKLDITLKAGAALVAASDAGTAYDQLIADGNADGNAKVKAVVDGLVDQTRSIERVIATLGLGNVALEGSDSLDNPAAVAQ